MAPNGSSSKSRDGRNDDLSGSTLCFILLNFSQLRILSEIHCSCPRATFDKLEISERPDQLAP
jgi:hypothetical protein